MWWTKKKTYETPEEYKKALVGLKDKLQVFAGNRTGNLGAIEKEAVEVLSHRDAFPQTYERYKDIEPLLGDIMSERVRSRAFQGMPPKGE